jgi:hypothetical protein
MQVGHSKTETGRVLNSAEHRRRWLRLRDESFAGGEPFEDTRREWEVVLAALRETCMTGRLDIGLAHRLADALDDTLRGHPPAAWVQRQRGHPSASRSEESRIARAQQYVQAVKDGVVTDPNPRETVKRSFDISDDTYDRWMKQEVNKALWVIDHVAHARLYGEDSAEGTLKAFLEGAGNQYRIDRHNPKKVRGSRNK